MVNSCRTQCPQIHQAVGKHAKSRPGLHLDNRHCGGPVRVSLQQLERLRGNVGPDRVAKQNDGQLLGQHKVSDEGRMVVYLVCQAEHLSCTTTAGNVVTCHHLSWLSGIGAPCLSRGWEHALDAT